MSLLAGSRGRPTAPPVHLSLSLRGTFSLDRPQENPKRFLDRPPPLRAVAYTYAMGKEGLEVSSFSRGKPHSPVEAAQNPAHFPEDLARLIDNWAALTAEDRRRITAIVEGRLA